MMDMFFVIMSKRIENLDEPVDSLIVKENSWLQEASKLLMKEKLEMIGFRGLHTMPKIMLLHLLHGWYHI